MEIRDVIGSLRERDLALQNEINAIRLAIHLIEYRLSKLDDVSRETKGDNGDGDASNTQLELPLEAPAPETGVGTPRVRRGGKPRRDVQ